MRLSRQDRTQAIVDAFHKAHGPCCAGCDWWQWHNSLVGECTMSAPVAGAERFAMIGIERSSLAPGAGHVMTPRQHVCGDFKDEQEESA